MICIFMLAVLILTVIGSKIGVELSDTDLLIMAILLVGDVILFKQERGRRER